MPTPAPNDEAPYAWVVVWACFVALAVIFGVSYSFAAFFESFISAFDAQRADVSLVFGLSGLIYFLMGAGAGILADRFGPRRITGAGMVVIALGLLGASAATSLNQVILAYGVGVGIGVGLVYVPAIGTVQPWFRRRRGLAAGLASAGIGAGTLLGPLAVAWAIALLGWRGALQALAAAVLLIGLSATWRLRRAPNRQPAKQAPANDLAQAATQAAAPLPAQAAAATQRDEDWAGMGLGEALRTPRFRWLYAMTLLAGPSMFVPFAHVSAAARDLGVDTTQAVGLVGLIGIGSLVGRFGIGALADRLGRPLTLVLALAAMGLSYLCWAAASGYAVIAVFALLLGLSYGGIVSLLPALCMDFFGGRAVASVIGVLYTGAALGNLGGPWLAGWVFDQSGSYAAVIWGCITLSALSTVAAWLAVKPEADRSAMASN